ncbi:hypothetical protein M758_11G065100 [Ceratodon purpureus]|nr:hypothetical protein M758_11G065100 [Ceratodon purpureus]
MPGTKSSAPPFQNYHARWQHSLASENVPPLFDYENYRAHRGPSFSKGTPKGTPSARSNADSGCGMGLSSIVNACFDSSDDHVAMQQQHQYSYPTPRSASVRAAVGPPATMAGGGFEKNYQKAKQQRKKETATDHGWNGTWSFLSQPAAEVPHDTPRESEDQKHVPWISLAIAIAYPVIFIMIMRQNDCPSNPRRACMLKSLRRFAFHPFGDNPLLGPSAKTLVKMGALESDLITKAHEGWRLLSSMWLHAGVLHIMGTILGMLVLGIPLERQLGFVKVGIIYVLSGFMGSMLSALMLHGRVSVGSSGAFMGLLGATLSSIIVNWSSHKHRSRTLIGVIFFIALNTVYGLMPFIDNFMHIGGAAMGFLLGNLFLIPHHLRYCWRSSAAVDDDITGVPGKTRKNAIVLDIAWLISLGAMVVAFIMGMFALFSGKDMSDGCSWCQYLTCVPSHYWRCTSSRNLGCNPSSFKGGLRVTCPNGRFFDYSTVQYASKLTPQIEGLCIKACI